MLDNLREIHIELTCKCQSWCALGFGDSMVNTDMIRIRKQDDKVIVEDLYSKGHFMPSLDIYQDIVPELGKITDTHITGIFKRFLRPLDPSDAEIPLGERMDLVWAISDDETGKIHSQNGYATAIFHDNTNKFKCHYKCIFCRGPLANQCISCKASNDILVNGYCQENDLTALPVSRKIDSTHRLTISWGYTKEEYIDIMIDTKTFGFFALIFGDSLEKADLVIFQVKTFYDELARIKHKRIEYTDMFSQSVEVIPDIDTVLGGNSDIQLLGYEINEYSQTIKVKIRRKLDTEDPFDKRLRKKETNFLYMHQSHDSIMRKYLITPSNPFVLDLEQEKTEKTDTWWKEAVRKSHTLFLFILWGPMTDIALVIIRYFKGNAAHIRIHGLIFVVVNSMTVLLVSLQIHENYDRISDLDGKGMQYELSHFIFGIIVLFMIFLQHSIGLALKIGLESSRKRFNVNFVKQLHRFIGITLYIFTKVSVMLGVYLWEDKYYGRYKGEKYWFTIGVSLYYSFLVIFFISMEICYRSEPDFAKRKQRYVYQELDDYQLISQLMDDLNSNLPSAEIVQNHPDIIYCILDNKVYDVTHMPHPGGQYILEHIKGRDIGRFFYGGYSLEQFFLSTHTHRIYAKNYLQRKYCGTIDNSQYNPLILSEETNDKELSVYNRPRNVWRLIRDEDVDNQISKTCKLFKFKSEHYKICNFLSGTQYFGRHFTLQPHGPAMLVDKRQYTMILCFQDAVIDFRIQMLKYFILKMGLNQTVFFEDEEIDDLDLQMMNIDDPDFQFQLPELISDQISFIIKDMDQSRIDKGFSHFIHNTQYNLYEMEGPFGQGLELTQFSSGTHFIFAGGTGILPFLDLFDYLLRKCVWTVLADKFSEKEADIINPFEENYIDDFPEDFKIVLFGSFLNVEEFYGFKIISDIYTISKMYNLNIMDCIVTFKYGPPNQQTVLPATTQQKYDEQFINQQIIEHGNPVKVLICGSPSMNRTIYSDCLNCGIPKSKLLYV